MSVLNLVVAASAGLAVAMSLFTYWLRRHAIYEPLLALLVGVAIGSEGLAWIDPRLDHPGSPALLETVARFTLAISLVTVGLELRGFLATHWRSLALLVAGGAVLMWLSSSLLVGVVLGLPCLTASSLAPSSPPSIRSCRPRSPPAASRGRGCRNGSATSWPPNRPRATPSG